MLFLSQKGVVGHVGGAGGGAAGGSGWIQVSTGQERRCL